MTDHLDSVFDLFLDRALRGDAGDVAEFLTQHPELSETERKQVHALADAVQADWLLTDPSKLTVEPGLPFERLGEFRLMRRLGEGGMGLVFLALQESLGRLVALKIIRPELAQAADAGARLQREARSVAKLRHPHVVTVFASGIDHGVHYLAMELVPGLGLDEVLREALVSTTPIPIAKLLRWIIGVARALAAAHEAQIIHRDIKPSNIRIRSGVDALLVDFGLARDLTEQHLTSSGVFRGTPHYASPEQVVASRGGVDARTDVFSLGVVLYECVTRRVPFRGDTTPQVFQQILVKEPEPPRRLNPDIPRDLEIVILKAIEKDRDRRYASAAEFADDLEAVLELRPIRARPDGRLRRTARWIRRHRPETIAAAAIVLAILWSIGFLISRKLAEQRREQEILLATISDLASHADAFIQATMRSQSLLLNRENALTLARMDLAAPDTPSPTAADERRLQDLEVEVTRLRHECTAAVLVLAEPLQRAALLDPGNLPAARRLVDLCMAFWRQAVATRDHVGERFWREHVLRLDSEQRHRAEIDGLGELLITANVDDFAVHLFEMQVQADRLSGGDHRLVPVPLQKDPSVVVPGTVVLRVTRTLADVVEDHDLILSVAGQPIRGSLLVVEAGLNVKLIDRLVSIDQRSVNEMFDVYPDGAEPRTQLNRAYQFMRSEDGSRYEVHAQSLAAIGVAVAPADVVVRRVPVRAVVHHLGESRDVDLPGGVEARITAAPLELSPRNQVDPTEAIKLPRGSFVAVVRAEGFEPQRIPFVVESGKTTELEIELNPRDTTPPGFVLIAKGRARLGGIPRAFHSREERLVDLQAFWIMEREITCEEYLQFVNDREVAGEVLAGAESGRWELVPRFIDGRLMPAFRFDRVANCMRVDPAYRTLPVNGVSWFDAQRFVAWKNRQLLAARDGWRFSLPTQDQWEKAARGVDGRMFVHGDLFLPTWVKTRRSPKRNKIDVGPEPGFRFPIDESPFGVFDLAGNVQEWCSGEVKKTDDNAPFSGGGWSRFDASEFSPAARFGLEAQLPVGGIGFRLVAERSHD